MELEWRALEYAANNALDKMDADCECVCSGPYPCRDSIDHVDVVAVGSGYGDTPVVAIRSGYGGSPCRRCPQWWRLLIARFDGAMPS